MINWLTESASSIAGWQAMVLLVGLLATPFVYRYQNGKTDRLGGPISWEKSLWLVFVIVLWYFVPALLIQQHSSMSWLLGSMLLRAMFEIPLCLVHRWKVRYGIAHDILHLALCIALFLNVNLPSELHWAFYLTIAALVCEIGFALTFKRATGGPERGYFFVSDAKEYRRINRITLLLTAPQVSLIIALSAISISRS